MSLFIWAQALPALDGKRKAILHVPGETANCSQWDLTYWEPQSRNKEWLGRVLLSWINIRGQTDLVNTQLLTFIEMHWMVVCIKQRIQRWDFYAFCQREFLTEIILHHWSHRACCRALRINPLFLGALRTKQCLNTPGISFMFYACTCLI